MPTKRIFLAVPLLGSLLLYASWSELVWYATQLSDTPEAYGNYVERYPDSEHVELALSCMDELEWRQTQSYQGVLGYEYYLDRLPNGPHAEAARVGLRKARLKEALEQGTRSAIDAYLEVYPQELQAPQVQALLEGMEWRTVLAQDSSSVYREFLQLYPQGAHADEAQERLDRLEFRTTLLNGDLEAWQAYVDSSPPEAYREQALAKLEQARWERIAAEPTIELVRDFLEDGLANEFAFEANGLLEDLVWRRAQDTATRAGVLAYLHEFPSGLYAASAKLQLEGIDWATALAQGTPQALQAYVIQYPEGSHVADVPRVQEELLWQRALLSDKVQAFEGYLQRFPEGPNAPAARAALVPTPALDLQAAGQLELSIQRLGPLRVELALELLVDGEGRWPEGSLTVGFSPGWLLRGKRQGAGDLVLLQGLSVRLRPGQAQAVELPVALLRGSSLGPKEDYSAALELDAELQAWLVQATPFQPPLAVLQLVLAIAVDNLNFAQLNELPGLSDKPLPAAAIAKAMKICRALDVPITQRLIWHDRALVRAELPEGELRQWLSHPESVGDAVRFGTVEQLSLLLEAGADPNLTGTPINGNANALGLAMEVNRLDVARELVSSGAELNRGTGELSLLGEAVMLGSVEWVRLLLEGGARPGTVEGAQDELMLAVTRADLEIVDLLLESGAPLNGRSEYEVPLNQAAAAGQLTCVKFLIAKGATLDLGVDSALISAAAGGHVGVLQQLIVAGADINRPGQWGYTALHRAAEQGHQGCAQALLQAGADVNRDAGGFSPMDLAAFRSPKLVEFLAANGAQETIFSAVALGDVDGIERCLARGESLERWGTGAHRPLHVAVRQRQPEALERLLSHGADANARSTEGLQPLHWAVKLAWTPAIEALVAHGADLNDASYAGTPLQLAVQAGDLKTTKLLLDLGSDATRTRAQDPSALEQAQAKVEENPGVYGPMVKLLRRSLGH